jgi:hypothetical protein
LRGPTIVSSPTELIVHEPAAVRDNSRLLHASDGAVTNHRFFKIFRCARETLLAVACRVPKPAGRKCDAYPSIVCRDAPHARDQHVAADQPEQGDADRCQAACSPTGLARSGGLALVRVLSTQQTVVARRAAGDERHACRGSAQAHIGGLAEHPGALHAEGAMQKWVTSQ